MYTEEEVRLELENVFAALPPCVQVVFANQRCQACGQVCPEFYFYFVNFFKTVILYFKKTGVKRILELAKLFLYCQDRAP
jgi:hypothetical protein